MSAADVDAERQRGRRDRRRRPRLLRGHHAGVRAAAGPAAVHDPRAGADPAALEPVARPGDAGLRPRRPQADRQHPERHHRRGRLGPASSSPTCGPAASREAIARALRERGPGVRGDPLVRRALLRGRAAAVGRRPSSAPASSTRASARVSQAPHEAFAPDPPHRRGDRLVLRQTGSGGLRGFLDLLWRRRRRAPRPARSRTTVVPGDALDFWRVEAFEPDALLRLVAEMKLPGRAWLEFEVEPGRRGLARPPDRPLRPARSPRPGLLVRALPAAPARLRGDAAGDRRGDGGRAPSRGLRCLEWTWATSRRASDVSTIGPAGASGDYVLYWMQIYRRLERNHALDYALRCAEELGRPLVVYEGLRLDYPWASRRLHRFILEGMEANAARAEKLGLNYWPFVETGHRRGPGPAAPARRAGVPGGDRRLPLLHRPRPVGGPGPEGRRPGHRRWTPTPSCRCPFSGPRSTPPPTCVPGSTRPSPRPGRTGPASARRSRTRPASPSTPPFDAWRAKDVAAFVDGLPLDASVPPVRRTPGGATAARSAPASVPEDPPSGIRRGPLPAPLPRRGPRERSQPLPALRPHLDRGGRRERPRHHRRSGPRTSCGSTTGESARASSATTPT